MSQAGNQARIFLALLAALRPHWRTDRNLPARIQQLIASQRAFGSRDRRLYRELIYTTLRYLPWIEPILDPDPGFATELVAWLAAETLATHSFRAALTRDWPSYPSQLDAKAAIVRAKAQREISPVDLLPHWFQSHCPAAFLPAQIEALLARAPLWLRVQTSSPSTVFQELTARDWAWRQGEVLANSLQLQGEVDVTKSDAYQQGRVEIQDLGSQLILETIGIAPGGRWLDACAGAGGKTLQLAALLGPGGHVDANDIRAAALAELASRARRAGLEILPPGSQAHRELPTIGNTSKRRGPGAGIAITNEPAPTYDGVLVDAPCSGSGTWRRSPHLKWTTTAGHLEEAARLQRSLLDEFSRRVRPGGQLVYATCSLSHVENEDVIAAFLAQHPDFFPAPFARTFGFEAGKLGLVILPAQHDTDGFFVASLRRK